MERLRLEAVQLELREAKMAQERESMEEDVSGMGRQREELQAQKAKATHHRHGHRHGFGSRAGKWCRACV